MAHEYPPPPLLRQAVWIRCNYRGEEFTLLCCRCGVVLTSPPDGPPTEPEHYLHIWGQGFAGLLPTVDSFTLSTFFIPCRYVVYIGLGPAIDFRDSADPKNPKIGDDVYWVISDPKDALQTSLEVIQATLKELADPA